MHLCNVSTGHEARGNTVTGDVCREVMGAAWDMKEDRKLLELGDPRQNQGTREGGERTKINYICSCHNETQHFAN